MIPSVGYLITSHISYTVPLHRLLHGLRLIGVDGWQTAVVLAGAGNEEVTQNFAGVRFFNAPHNSFDLTGAIELVRRRFDFPKHVLLLHDTMEVGPRTQERAMMANPDHWATAAFGGQCNLILCHMEWLLKQEAFLLGERNCTKLRAVETEGALWKTCPPERRSSFANSGLVTGEVGTPYSEVPRLKEYYAGLDIVKWKANWGQNWQSMEVRA